MGLNIFDVRVFSNVLNGRPSVLQACWMQSFNALAFRLRTTATYHFLSYVYISVLFKREKSGKLQNYVQWFLQLKFNSV